jgi:hypothetical protein
VLPCILPTALVLPVPRGWTTVPAASAVLPILPLTADSADTASAAAVRALFIHLKLQVNIETLSYVYSDAVVDVVSSALPSRLLESCQAPTDLAVPRIEAPWLIITLCLRLLGGHPLGLG